MTILKINQGRWFASDNMGIITEDTRIINTSNSSVFDLTVENTPVMDDIGVLQRDTKGGIWYSQLTYDADFGEPCLDIQLNQGASDPVWNPVILSFYVDISDIIDDVPFLLTESYSNNTVQNKYFLQFVRLKENGVYNNYLVNNNKTLFCRVPNKFKFELISALDHNIPASASSTFEHEHEVKINGYSVGCITWVNIQKQPTHMRLCNPNGYSVKISDISVYRYVELSNPPRAQVKIVKENETDDNVTLRALLKPDYETTKCRIELLLKGSVDGNPYASVNTGKFDRLQYTSCLQNLNTMSQKLFFKDENGYGVVCNASVIAINSTGEHLNENGEFFNFFDNFSTSNRVISAGTNCDTSIILDFPDVYDVELIKGFGFISGDSLNYIKAKLFINESLVREVEFSNLTESKSYYIFDNELKIDRYKIVLNVLEADLNQYATISEGVFGELTYVSCESEPESTSVSENIIFTDGVENYSCTVTMDAREANINDDFAPHNFFAPADKRTSAYGDISSGGDTLTYTIEFNDPVMLAKILSLKINAGSRERLARQVRYELFDSDGKLIYTDKKNNTTFNYDYEMIFDPNIYTVDLEYFDVINLSAGYKPSYYFKIIITTPSIGNDYVTLSNLKFPEYNYKECLNSYTSNVLYPKVEDVILLKNDNEIKVSVSKNTFIPVYNRILVQPTYYYRFVVTPPSIDGNVTIEDFKFNQLTYKSCTTKYVSSAKLMKENVVFNDGNTNINASVNLLSYTQISRILNYYASADNFCELRISNITPGQYFMFSQMTVDGKKGRGGTIIITNCVTTYAFPAKYWYYSFYGYVNPPVIHNSSPSNQLNSNYLYKDDTDPVDYISIFITDYMKNIMNAKNIILERTDYTANASKTPITLSVIKHGRVISSVTTTSQTLTFTIPS